MTIKIALEPKSDSYNSYPPEVDFEIDDEEVILYLYNENRVLTFDKKDFTKINKIMEVVGD